MQSLANRLRDNRLAAGDDTPSPRLLRSHPFPMRGEGDGSEGDADLLSE